MTEFQQQLVRFLEEFDKFCREQKIEYCLMWGSLLGCIREGGFIPWDDDIDVAMDRPNFEKFKNLAQEGKLPPNFAFEDSFFLKGCRVPKVRDKEQSVRDRNGGDGIFIDIFPFDRFSSIETKVLLFASYGLHIRDYRRKISNKFLRAVYTPLSFIPYLFFIAVRRIYSGRNSPNGKYTGKAVIMNPEVFFTVEEFYPFQRKKFETLSIPVPNGYDSILRKVYGKYWIPVNWNNKHY